MKEMTMVKIVLALLILATTIGVTTFFMIQPNINATHDIPEIDDRKYVIFPELDDGNCSPTTTRLNTTHCIRFIAD